MRAKTLMSLNKMRRSMMLAAAVFAGLATAIPAQAGAVYSGLFDMALKVVSTQDGVTITGDTELLVLDTTAVGGIGTFASAALNPNPTVPTVLGAGDALTMTTDFFFGFEGESGNGPELSKATSDVHAEGVVAVQNGSTNNAKVVFELTYSLLGSASIDDATFDAAFLSVIFEISTQSGFSLFEEIVLDLPSGGLLASDTLSDTLQFTLGLNAGASDEISISARLKGIAETQATPVPLPGSLPLVAVGIAALCLTYGRRHARSV